MCTVLLPYLSKHWSCWPVSVEYKLKLSLPVIKRCSLNNCCSIISKRYPAPPNCLSWFQSHILCKKKKKLLFWEVPSLSCHVCKLVSGRYFRGNKSNTNVRDTRFLIGLFDSYGVSTTGFRINVEVNFSKPYSLSPLCRSNLELFLWGCRTSSIQQLGVTYTRLPYEAPRFCLDYVQAL